MSIYADVFGHEPEPWREPLGALRLTLADETPPEWGWERARSECEDLVRALNREPDAERIRNAVWGVLWNASNYPREVQPHILATDVTPLVDRVTRAVLEAL